jgi:hypothetical protein
VQRNWSYLPSLLYAGINGASGVRVGVLIVKATGQSDLVAGCGFGSGSEVQVIDNLSLQPIDDFFAFCSPPFQTGVFVAGGEGI